MCVYRLLFLLFAVSECEVHIVKAFETSKWERLLYCLILLYISHIHDFQSLHIEYWETSPNTFVWYYTRFLSVVPRTCSCEDYGPRFKPLWCDCTIKVTTEVYRLWLVRSSLSEKRLTGELEQRHVRSGLPYRLSW